MKHNGVYPLFLQFLQLVDIELAAQTENEIVAYILEERITLTRLKQNIEFLFLSLCVSAIFVEWFNKKSVVWLILYWIRLTAKSQSWNWEFSEWEYFFSSAKKVNK